MKHTKTQEQTSLFDALEDVYVTPVLPPEEQKAGMHGWCVEARGVKNSLDDNAPFLWLEITPRRVILKRDTRRDKYGWDQWAVSDDGKDYMGWAGFGKLLFRKEPSVGDMLKIALKRWPQCAGLPYKVR